MVSVEEATGIIQSNLMTLNSMEVSLSESIGHVLDEDITADRDFPPFDRVMMDGIVINYESWQAGNKVFPVQEMLPAGSPKTTLNDPGSCIEIMTGAILPDGSDTVIPYEEVKYEEGEPKTAEILSEELAPGANIHRQGLDRKQGDLLVRKGTSISPAEVAVMASVGKSRVEVKQWPKVALISTGDELVEVGEVPAEHQIRMSNSYSLQASLWEMGIPSEVFHIHDEKQALRDRMKSILEENPVVILSGGVSKGKRDFIPEILDELGIEKLFHRVSQRPGKPFWFGKSEQTTVFALPGNPVSTFMCFYRFVKPWLISSAGLPDEDSKAKLSSDFEFKPDLTYFLQVNIAEKEGTVTATPIPGRGSGDFANLLEADGFLELPKGTATYEKGRSFSYFPFR